jgi:hypothetical protein
MGLVSLSLWRVVVARGGCGARDIIDARLLFVLVLRTRCVCQLPSSGGRLLRRSIPKGPQVATQNESTLLRCWFASRPVFSRSAPRRLLEQQ